MRLTSILICLAVLLTACSSTGKKSGNQAETHYTLGLSFLQEGQPTLALKEFLRAEEMNPRDADVQAGLGQAYQLKRAYPEAEKHYLQALKLRPGDPQNQNNLAALYLDMQRWDDSIRYFRLAAENLTFSNQEVAFTGLGMAHFQKGLMPEAVVAFREALILSPRYLQARLLLGETYLALGKNGEASAEFQRALELAPSQPRAHFQLGLARMRQGESEKAKESFRNVLRLAPNSEFARHAEEYINVLN